MELSGWQTVFIALGGGLITGTAALLVAFLSGKSAGKQLESRVEHERQQQTERLDREREERWTERQVRAADDFATGVEQAIIGVRALIAVVQEQRDAGPAVVEAHRLVHEAVARLARIRLLFRQARRSLGLPRSCSTNSSSRVSPPSIPTRHWPGRSSRRSTSCATSS